ncbi:MAG: hypothetical protein LBN27_00290, partial [Prevotellaceae bacterium]|nr:hypothetical protein [Prevotellaceae bacterium]
MIKRFLPAEILTLLYILLTGIYILIFKQNIYFNAAGDMMLFRLLFACIIYFFARYCHCGLDPQSPVCRTVRGIAGQ